MSNRTIRVLVVIGVILVAAWGIAQYSEARRTGKHLEALGLREEPGKIMDALAELRSRGPSIGPRLAAIVQTQQSPQAGRAAWLLGLVGSHAGDEALVQALNAEDTALKLAALQSLGRLRVYSAESSVTAVVDDAEAKPEVRATAITTLGMLGTETAAATLARVLDGRPKPVPEPVEGAAPAEEAPPDTTIPLRLAAVRSLGTMRQPAGVDALARTLAPETEPDNEVRIAAAYALGDLTAKVEGAEHRSAGVRGLLDGTKDEVGDVRIAALYSLAKVQVPPDMSAQVAEALKQGSGDKHYWARLAADMSRASQHLTE